METLMKKTNTITEEAQGWIASYIKENPGAEKILSTHKIYNDASYLSMEYNLDWIIRQKLGIFRTHHLVGENCKDPCKIAHAAPPWLAKRKLTSFNFTPTICKNFEKNNLITVANLATWTSEKLLNEPWLGHKTLHYVSACLKNALNTKSVLNAKQSANTDMDNHAAADISVNQNDPEQLKKILLYARNCKDPCKLARVALPWLGNLKLKDINIPTRPSNILTNEGVETIADFATCSSEELLKKRWFGRQSLQNILNCLNITLTKDFILDRKQNSDIKLIPIAQTALNLNFNFIESMRYFLLSLDQNDRYYIERRLAFETTSQTMPQISDKLNIPLKDISSIKIRVMKKLKNTFFWHIFMQKMTRLINSANSPLPLDRIAIVDLWFSGIYSHQIFFKNLINMAGGSDMHVISINGTSYLSTIKQSAWNNIVKEAKALLSSSIDKKWSEAEACLHVQELLPDNAKKFAILLWNQVSHLCLYKINSDNTRILIEYGKNIKRAVRVILCGSDSPMHYQEIIKAAKLNMRKNLNQEQVCTAAAKISFLFNKRTYGLDKHIPFSDKQIAYICQKAEYIVCANKTKKQWHIHEILPKLSEQLDENFEKLDTYLLNIVLHKSKKLSYLKRMVWTTTERANAGAKRIHRDQAILAILRKAGHPLRNSQIKKQLETEGSIYLSANAKRKAPLVNIKPCVWGLLDRDVPISSAEQRKLIQKLVDKLSEKQSAIHINELPDILPLQNCSPTLLLTITTQDKRLKYTKNKYIYLVEWGESRIE